MAVFLWTIRTLASLFLGLAVAAAFPGWLVCSGLVSDLNSEDSQLVRLAELGERIEHPDAADFRRAVQEVRDGTNNHLAQARNFLLTATIVGVAAAGLIHLPDATASLRWPGYTLLATGVFALFLAWLAQATLPEIAGRVADPQVSEEAQGAVTELLRGSIKPGIWSALTGTTLVIAFPRCGPAEKSKGESTPRYSLLPTKSG